MEEIINAIEKLQLAEARGNHCKTTLNIYEYYNSYKIDEIDRYLKQSGINWSKDGSNRHWVEYTLELK